VALISSKWAPAAAVAVLITSGIIAVPMSASAVDLPERSVDEVMELMDLEFTAFSGTVVKTTDLGLPALEMSQMISEEMVAEMEESMPEGFEDFVPQLIEDNTLTEAIAFIAGTDTIRLFVSEEGMRAQILDPLSQRDVVINSTEAWYYNARTQTAMVRDFGQELVAPDWDEVSGSFEVDLSNPDALIAAFLEEAGPGTTVTAGENVMVAGRAAYTLIVQPGSSASLVESVSVQIDAETGLGLALTVFSTEQVEPALSVAFESISYDTPDAALFSFSPPPGTTVETLEFPAEFEAALVDLRGDSLTDAQKQELARSLANTAGEGIEPQYIGEGFETVVFLEALPSSVPLDLLESELFSDLVVAVDGGVVFQTPLSTVFLSDNGSVWAGAVSVDFLLAVAAG
jgi:outer membrane lipoprotein-sorting protein